MKTTEKTQTPFPPDLSNREWLSRFFRWTRLGPWGIFVLFVVINLLTTIPVALAYNAWLPNPPLGGLQGDWTAYLNDDLAIPIIFAFFHWIQTSGTRMFRSLIKDGVIPDTDETRVLLGACQKRLESRWVPIAGAAAGLIFAVWFVVFFTSPSNPEELGWVVGHPMIPWWRSPMMFLSIYALVVFLIDIGIIMITLNATFHRLPIRVEPLHPDSAGGLSAIGGFTSALGYLFFILGLAFSVRIMNQNMADYSGADDAIVWLGLVVYVVAAPLSFFLPLRAARAAMKNSRDSLIREISSEFNAIFEEIRSLRSEEAEKIEPYLKRYRQIEETRNMIEKFPVWPFNTENLRNFFSLIVLPIVPALISILIDLFK